MTIKWPESLIHEISERRVVIFVGTGISKFSDQSIPTWSNLLEDLSNFLTKKKDKLLIKKLIKDNRLLDAAQIICDNINRADLNTKLRSIFQVRPIPHNDIYRNILDLDPKIIVTTNYDEFIEKNFEHFSGGNEAHCISDHRSRNLVNDLRSPMRSIIKIHGSVTDPSTVVLDRLSYFTAKRENPSIFSVISSIMTVNTVLFLGYSINDPDIQLILENISIVADSQHPHYAVIPKFDHASIRGALENAYNIKFLEYPAGQHASVGEAVSSLRDSVIQFRQNRAIV